MVSLISSNEHELDILQDFLATHRKSIQEMESEFKPKSDCESSIQLTYRGTHITITEQETFLTIYRKQTP